MRNILLAATCCLLLSSCQSYVYQENKSFINGLVLILIIAFFFRRMTKPDPAKQLDKIHSHQSHHFENFQLSSDDFYKELELIIKTLEFPNVKTQVIAMSTGGAFAPKREYLEVSSNDNVFYVCAAPHGRNFFISYWLRETEEEDLDRFLRKMFGVTNTKSFFQVDTEAMFVESIKKAVRQAIELSTEQRGLRNLSPAELEPTILS